VLYKYNAQCCFMFLCAFWIHQTNSVNAFQTEMDVSHLGSKVKVQGHSGIKYAGNSSLRAKAWPQNLTHSSLSRNASLMWEPDTSAPSLSRITGGVVSRRNCPRSEVSQSCSGYIGRRTSDLRKITSWTPGRCIAR